MNETDFKIPLRKAVQLTGLSPQTIRKWGKHGKIKTFITPSKQQLYYYNELSTLNSNISNSKKTPITQKENFLYARVSSKKQLEDLHRQIQYLRQSPFSHYTLITDCASGINFQRKGLKTILESAFRENIGHVVVAHKDRLCRFAFDLINWIISSRGGEIIILDESNSQSDNDELANDVLSIIQIFNCKQMGKRRYKNKVSNDSSLSNYNSKTTIK